MSKKQIIKIAKNKKDTEQKLENTMKVFTESFNKLDGKSGFIETLEREDIYDALLKLLEENKKHFGEKMNIAKLTDKIFDNARDW